METIPPAATHDVITVGRLVEVASRTWPGINKPGGVARVMEVHFDHNNDEFLNHPPGDNDDNPTGLSSFDSGAHTNRPTHVNVKYILGGSREKRVPVEYVKLAPQYESTNETTATTPANGTTTVATTKTLRDRSMLLGRCRRCGSLRKDCGSCDWVTEETMAKNDVDQRRFVSGIDRKRKPVENAAIHQQEQDPFSSNDDDDDEEIEKLIRKLSRRHGHHPRRKKLQVQQKNKQPINESIKHRDESLRRKVHQESALLTATSINSRKSEGKATSKMNQHVQNDSLSSSEDEGHLEVRHNRRILHQRYQAYSKLSGYSALTSLDFPSSSSSSSSSEDETLEQIKQRRRARMVAKRKKAEGFSVLESLPTGSHQRTNTADRSTADSIDEIQGERQGDALSFPGVDADDSEESILEQSTHSPETDWRVTIRSSTSSSDSDSMKYGNTNVLDSSSSIIDQQLLALEARARREGHRIQGQNFDGGRSALEDFIQPEGEAAVENLPSDMVDLSKSIPYKDLAPFFDTLATKLEDETIPDFKLKIALFQRQMREIQNPRTIRQPNNSTDDAKLPDAPGTELLEQCDDLWAEARATLIRNGSDQCRAALRRLMNDRLYRKAKKKLTISEQRSCRGPGVMDARNLRLDAIEESVEEIVHRLKRIVEQCEEECLVDAYATNNERPVDSDFSNGSMVSDQEGTYSSQPLLDLSFDDNDQTENERNTATTALHLHPHASKARKNRKELQIQTKKRSRSSPYTRTSTTRKKSRDDGERMPFEHLNKMSSKSSTRSNDATSNVVESILSSDESMNNDGFKPLDGEEGGTGDVSKNDVKAETHPQNTRMDRPSTVQRKTTRQRKFETSIRSPLDRNQSISQRMQAFLDANTGHGDAELLEENGVGQSLISERYMPEGEIRHQRNEPFSDGFQVNVQREKGLSRQMKRTYCPVLKQQDLSNIESWPATAFHQNFLQMAQMAEEVPTSADAQERVADLVNALPNLFEVDSTQFLHYTINFERALHFDPHPPSSFFVNLHTMLTASARAKTTQEVLLTSRNEFHRHVRFLALCVRCLKKVQSDQDLPAIFCRTGREHFVDFLIVQLLDTLHSLFMPLAWGMDTGIDVQRVLIELVPLRDALSESVNLLESSCRLLVQRFPCQQWRRHLDGSDAYISSVDPFMWKEFLQTGLPPKNPERTRFAALGDVWPEVEICSLWRIMAFIGGSRSNLEGSSAYRWQVFSKLFSAGSLASLPDMPKTKIPCAPKHLDVLKEETTCFATLLLCGNMNCLPKTDSMIVNLIQRALALQAETYAGDQRARLDCFPGPVNLKEERKQADLFLRFTDPIHLESIPVHSCTMTIFDMILECSSSYDGDRGYRDTLKPSSKLLSSCIALLAGWCKNIPKKKARQVRFSKAIDDLQNTLLKNAKQLKANDHPSSDEETLFESAFPEKLPVEIGCGTTRAAVFLKEASTMLRIFGCAFESSSLLSTMDFSTAIWSVISDSDLQGRQQILSDSTQKRDLYVGDPYILFANAKIMATLLFLQMNASPWHPSLGKSLRRVFESHHREKGQTVWFGLSCIFACLDCLLDVDINIRILSHLYKIIILIFQTMTSKLRYGEEQTSGDHLKYMYLTPFASVLTRCAQLHLSSQTSSQDGVHFRYFLTVVRSIQCFFATYLSVAQLQDKENTIMQEEDELIWGGIDDEVLASMDLNAIISGSSKQRKSQEEIQMWKFLSNVVEMSKPSDRFKIDSSHLAISDVFIPSTFGKCLVSNEIIQVCDCLSFGMATAPEMEVDSDVAGIISKWIHPPIQDNEDADFFQKIGERLASNVCLLANRHSKCQKFVFKHLDVLLFSLLSSLLDSRRLESFPSCNLDRILERTGNSGLEQALALLDLLNDDTLPERSQSSRIGQLQRRRRKQAAEIWSFCANFGNALVVVSDAGMSRGPFSNFAHALLHVDEDLPRPFACQINLISLEKESFKVVCFLRSFISRVATCADVDIILVERVASWSLFSLANQILGISRSLRYHEQSAANQSRDFEQSVRGSKLSNLLSCYVEIFVCLVVWIIRELRHDGSAKWTELLRVVRDKFLSPVLRRQPGEITAVLQDIAASAKATFGINTFQESKSVGIPGCAKFFGGEFFKSIVRRSKQLLVTSALNKEFRSLHNAILEAVLNAGKNEEDLLVWRVGTSFPLTYRTSTNHKTISFEHPLHKEIDRYFCLVEEGSETNFDDDDRRKVHEMKQSFLTVYVLPRLCHKRLECSKRCKVLKLLSYLLECHANPSSSNTSRHDIQPLLDFDSVGIIIKGLTLNMHQCLGHHEIDDGFINSVFTCARNLANALVPVDGSTECLLEWSGRKIESITGKSMVQLYKAEVDAAYAWIFFQWVHCIASMVANMDEGFEADMSILRQVSREQSNHRGRGLDEEPLDLDCTSTRLEHWQAMLGDFESFLFPSRSENTPNVINVYAKESTMRNAWKGATSSEDDVVVESWRPTSSTRRSAKEFVATIVAIL
ncbi:hypothetical protein IV203_034713 [Nitzschia inconspicua]|uniref:Uncharacterized protein n=1 Tax=Nitzschia inconspicua TaxID=303405 RepID=A0A9K3LBW6_9STRA|nr:hypothetical protein IV203_034713 [Nitzschia inconspicua]